MINEDQFEIQKEMLELSIKAGRRAMHDFDHMLNEVPEGNMWKKEYRERGKHWKSIFYPDDGMKNYRNSLHKEIESLDYQLRKARELLVKHGIDPNPDLGF